MISRNILSDLLFMILLIMLQVYLFNKMLLFDYSGVFYIVFVLFYPFYRNQYVFLALCFLLGLGVDAILGSWGINAFASTFIGFFRSVLFKNQNNQSDGEVMSFDHLNWLQFMGFIFSSVLVHQFLVQYLELFKNSKFLELLLTVSITSMISFVFILLYVLFFKIKQRA
jgi:hypothetical protein